MSNKRQHQHSGHRRRGQATERRRLDRVTKQGKPKGGNHEIAASHFAGCRVLPAQAQTVDICDRTAQVRDAILEALDADDCTAVDSDGMANIEVLYLQEKQLTALQGRDFDSLTNLRFLYLNGNQLTTLPAAVFDGLTNLELLYLYGNQLAALPPAVFDNLTSLQALALNMNRLAFLPAGVFDSLTSLQVLALGDNPLTILPDGVFDSLIRLDQLYLQGNQLAFLPAGVFDSLIDLLVLSLHSNRLAFLPADVFDSLTKLQTLHLGHNGLAFLPASVFDGLTRLQILWLNDNQLTTLPDGVFDDLTRLVHLWLVGNQLTTLPAGVFDSLASVNGLYLQGNQLATLPAGVFDGLATLGVLRLQFNQLAALPGGVFDGLTFLVELDLRDNHLAGLTRNNALFAGFSAEVDILLNGQTPEARLMAAVPLMLSTSDSTRQGFVRIVNESQESGSVRVFAVDDSGHAPDPIEIPLGAGQVVHFNSNDLENGNARKGIEGGVGGPVQGDWRLDVESALPVRVLAFVRTTDGFLTAMHDVLPRNDEGRLAAQTFNPGSNMNQESRLRLANTGTGAASVTIYGTDDQGNDAGPVELTLAEGESRTLSAFDLENGAQGLAGALGDGGGKWRLLITAGRSVVGVSLLASVTGHLTNISTAGVADE